MVFVRHSPFHSFEFLARGNGHLEHDVHWWSLGSWFQMQVLSATPDLSGDLQGEA